MKVIIIGAGPGGYVCAIRAAQLGAEVHLIERETVGGTCLNVGCIPTKVLLHAADTLNTLHGQTCIKTEGLSLDWAELQREKQRTVNQLVRGVDGLLRANGVSMHKGEAFLKTANTVSVGGESLSADAIVLATGSSPSAIPFQGNDLPGVIDSTEALSLEAVPKSLAILGGGVIGCEFAYLYSSLGAKVAVVEMLPQILPTLDGQIAAKLRKALEQRGVEIHASARLQKARQADGALTLELEVEAARQEELLCEKLLVAVGRRPNTSGLNLEGVGVKTENGAVKVDADFSTNIPGIYAIGDCNGQIMLAHAASAQGEYVAEAIMGKQGYYNADCIYTQPQVASVGLSEKAAQSAGVEYKLGLFPMAGNGKALIDGGRDGLVKVLASPEGQLLGAHIIGPDAVEMIGEMALAINIQAMDEDITSTIHPHPSVSEAIAEAVLALTGRAIHWPPGVEAK